MLSSDWNAPTHETSSAARELALGVAVGAGDKLERLGRRAGLGAKVSLHHGGNLGAGARVEVERRVAVGVGDLRR